jgi:hypothetical protein
LYKGLKCFESLSGWEHSNIEGYFYSLNWDIIMKNLFVIPGKTEELSGLTTLTTNLKANVPVVLAREGFRYFL